MATRGRLDRARDFFRTAEDELAASGVADPDRLRRENPAAGELLAQDAEQRRGRRATGSSMFTMWPIKLTPGLRPPGWVSPQGNRLPAYRGITTPVLVIGFADDVVTPPHLGREVADAMPERPVPADRRHRASRLPGAARGRQRRGAEVLRQHGRQLTHPSPSRATRCVGWTGESLDGTGPRRRRRTDPRRCPRRGAVPGLAQRPAGVRAAGRRPGRPAAAARPHRRAHRRVPGRSAWRSPRARRCASR